MSIVNVSINVEMGVTYEHRDANGKCTYLCTRSPPIWKYPPMGISTLDYSGLLRATNGVLRCQRIRVDEQERKAHLDSEAVSRLHDAWFIVHCIGVVNVNALKQYLFIPTHNDAISMDPYERFSQFRAL
jgi:hypothetical protein